MVDRYIDSFSQLFSRDKNTPEVRYLQFLVRGFIATRNARVADLASEKMQEARLFMERVIGASLEEILPCLCIDGRVLVETVFGLSGESFRTPAADISDALRMKDGSFYLVEGDFTREIRDRVRKFGRVVVILDSHSHCAAKGEEEKASSGVPASDGGLLNDVMRKKDIALAIHDFSNRAYGNLSSEKVFVIQTSFDVERGFLFMGLDQGVSLSDHRVTREGYTGAVLEALARERKTLSTAVLSENGGILFDVCEQAKSQVGEIDFRRHYDESMRRLWMYIADIWDEVAPRLRSELKRIFPVLAEDSVEFRLRMSILLSNAILGHLLSSGGGYPYKQHQEGVVVVTTFARGPYDMASPFPVNGYSNGGVAMLSYVAGFAASIVRGNRGAGRFPEGERSFIEECFGSDVSAFVKSPVPVFISERVYEDVPKEVAEGLSALEWGETSWADMSSDELAQFLWRNVPGISEGVVDGIKNLRTRALELYRPGLPATQHLLSGQLALVSSIRMGSGKVVAVFPFLLNGYPEGYLRSIGKIQ
ncbi:MAG: hypothetical protein IPK84_01315 [Candidatus Moraniibacteriota bacterium]|nr:MAG: hypothetical protein IPK84_01315 [Candidatus Moranbacteria bacterium]